MDQCSSTGLPDGTQRLYSDRSVQSVQFLIPRREDLAPSTYLVLLHGPVSNGNIQGFLDREHHDDAVGVIRRYPLPAMLLRDRCSLRERLAILQGEEHDERDLEQSIRSVRLCLRPEVGHRSEDRLQLLYVRCVRYPTDGLAYSGLNSNSAMYSTVSRFGARFPSPVQRREIRHLYSRRPIRRLIQVALGQFACARQVDESVFPSVDAFVGRQCGVSHLLGRPCRLGARIGRRR